jgi:hypothetical protein
VFFLLNLKTMCYNVGNFSVFYGTGKFSTTFTKAPLVPTLTQINPVYTAYYFLKFHFIITLQSTLPSSKWPLFLRSLHQNPACNPSVSHTCYVPRPSHASFPRTSSAYVSPTIRMTNPHSHTKQQSKYNN